MGGHAQIVPMSRINLHFTGEDSRHHLRANLLAAMLENHIYWATTSASMPAASPGDARST